jgi:hypothetical protein
VPPPQGATGEAFIFDFGLPDYFGTGVHVIVDIFGYFV